MPPILHTDYIYVCLMLNYTVFKSDVSAIDIYSINRNKQILWVSAYVHYVLE